jgi:tetratricopeptide (TPR) repeat protein
MDKFMSLKNMPTARYTPMIPKVPWVVRHAQQILVALGAAAVVLVLGAYVVSKLRQADSLAWERLSAARAQSLSGRRDEALKAINTLLGSRRSGPVAVQSSILKSEILIADGKPSDALLVAQQALRRSASPEYRSLAMVNLEYVQEENGDREGALNTCESFLKTFPDHYLVPRIQGVKGRLLFSLNRFAEAKETLENLVTLFPSTSWSEAAKSVLSHLPPSKQ